MLLKHQCPQGVCFFFFFFLSNPTPQALPPPTQIVIKRTDDVPAFVARGKTLKQAALSANIRCLLSQRSTAAVIGLDEHCVATRLGKRKMSRRGRTSLRGGGKRRVVIKELMLMFSEPVEDIYFFLNGQDLNATLQLAFSKSREKALSLPSS